MTKQEKIERKGYRVRYNTGWRNGEQCIVSVSAIKDRIVRFTKPNITQLYNTVKDTCGDIGSKKGPDKFVIAPEGCQDYLTPGKRYKIAGEYPPDAFKIMSDNGNALYCLYEECGHLRGGNWIIEK